MFESVLLTAFVIGLISAFSLPLGAVTTFFWHPSDRTVAVLMAFGGGALLAALTIDLVGSALEMGHFNSLAVGAVSGGSMFLALNRIVNDYGGFARKVSTTVYHLRRKQHQRLKHTARQLKRLDLFGALPDRDFRLLASSIHTLDVRKGGWIYQAGDPSDYLYIVIAGDVELINPRERTRPPEPLGKHDVFGWRAVLTGTPFCYSAFARSNVSLWLLPKQAFDMLNLNSEEARQKAHLLLRGREVMDYLVKDQGLEPAQAGQWVDQAVTSLLARGVVPPAAEVSRNSEAFLDSIDRMQHIPLMNGLSATAQEMLSNRVIYKHHTRGTTFYHQYDTADRLFIIDRGEVDLIDANTSSPEPERLKDFDGFGDLSMITGAKHSVTAVAAADTAVWELRKSDFNELLDQLPELLDRVRAYVRQAGAEGYLVNRQHLDAEQTARWVRHAMRNLDAGHPVPAAADLRHEITENKGAPLAIWMGITLDGIPESLVIGASMIHAHLEFSLITGLFLSNYPEALSSSVGMRKQGMSKARVLLMWSSLMLFTGIGAALGSEFFIGASPESYALVEGLAAGAMLTMIAETMLPEAYFKGGSVVGISTLMGFLIAIFTKTLE